MKPEIAKLWVEALRSGKYKQATGTLKDVRGYCCLGVLCDISALHEWGGTPGCAVYGPLNTRVGVLPRDVMDWSGVKTETGKLPSGWNLSALNDVSCKKFTEIADIIEENVEAL